MTISKTTNLITATAGISRIFFCVRFFESSNFRKYFFRFFNVTSVSMTGDREETKKNPPAK